MAFLSGGWTLAEELLQGLLLEWAGKKDGQGGYHGTSWRAGVRQLVPSRPEILRGSGLSRILEGHHLVLSGASAPSASEAALAKLALV